MLSELASLSLESPSDTDPLPPINGILSAESVVSESWAMYRGDCCEVARTIPDNSVDMGIHSPPFANLYIYSDSEADMGNCESMDEFIEHYRFIIREMHRITVPGRVVAVHCKDLPKYANRDDTAGLIDFPGKLIDAYEQEGWSFHSRVTIWKCPVTERERTNNNGLLHKTACRDRSQLRQGMADYLLVFRKPPVGTLMSDKPVAGIERDTEGNVIRQGFIEPYVGELSPRQNDLHPSPFARKNNAADLSIDIWRRYAEPVWFDVNQTDVLNFKLATTEQDEKHICLARGSLVLTRERGHVPIEDLEIGEHVLTHLGRWRPIIAKQKTSDSAEVVSVRAQGVHSLTVTPTHKLWVRKTNGNDTRKRQARKAIPEWAEAQSIADCFVNLKLPPEECTDVDCETWWIVGRWIADGHIAPRGTAHISIGKGKVESTLKAIGNRAGFTQESTSVQVLIKDSDHSLRDILERCGRGAKNKHLPPEAFTLPKEQAKALLDGYLSGDGHYDKSRDRWSVSTVSRELAIGLQFLIQRAYESVATIHAGRPDRQCVIEGRTVNASQEWCVSFNVSNYSHGFIQDDGAWKPVKTVENAGQAETWNIRVLEDESYTAEGCIVKNCPLQVDLIRRSVQIWSNPGDVVFSPFAGIGSEGYGAVLEGRKFVGIELKDSYFRQAQANLRAAEEKMRQGRMF